jgi:glucose-6-phosphate 1-dehydrogenase
MVQILLFLLFFLPGIIQAELKEPIPGLKTEIAHSIKPQSEPFVCVIFGALGDLTSRKLIPALFHLSTERHLPEEFAVVGVARRSIDFRNEMKEALDQFSRGPKDDSRWKEFESKLFYVNSHFEDDEGYLELKSLMQVLDEQLGTKGNRIFFLAIPPDYCGLIVEKLTKHGLIHKKEGNLEPWSRVIIEKPFGKDFDSAIALQDNLSKHLEESQIYRMDHYLGKLGVLNLISFRFENALFEPIWNNRYIDHVQISMGEEIGIGSRGKFWEGTGALRDLVQNHLLQLLTVVAMDPPHQLESEEIRKEKIKLLNAVSPIPPIDIDEHFIRGQYGEGVVRGTAVRGYREEEGVASSSCVETFVAAKLFIDNPRWEGVPFYLKAGKRLNKQSTEVLVVFKKPPISTVEESNVLLFRIQPNPGIFLKTLSNVPHLHKILTPVVFGYQPEVIFGNGSPEAYEKLIYDCAIGDSSLFVSGEEQLAAWKILDPILKHWDKEKVNDFPNYPAGTVGPPAAQLLLEREGNKWLSIEEKTQGKHES